MKIAPPAQVNPHSPRNGHRDSGPRGELILRYVAAYACTLVAIAAAQLYVPTPFALLLAGITLAGLPISLFLRWSKLVIFGRRIPRFLVNSLIVIATAVACFYLLVLTQADMFARGIYQTVMISHSAGDSIAILMSMFLIFAATRSLAIINDKDAVLSAVPSFSVLLLLIVVHRGPAVVAYFLMWALVAAVLFALDHRQESRQSVGGTIPSLEPGQDVKLSARGLATVMSFSLVCAVGISYWLSSRNPDERGLVEGWILGVAGRMTQLALNIPDVSVNSGPERQIDFTSGPSLPTRTELWLVRAITYNWLPIQPEYWRMFTLTQYNGTTWSQTPGSGTAIPLQRLDEAAWPPLPQPPDQSGPTFNPRRRTTNVPGGGNIRGGGGGGGGGSGNNGGNGERRNGNRRAAVPERASGGSATVRPTAGPTAVPAQLPARQAPNSPAPTNQGTNESGGATQPGSSQSTQGSGRGSQNDGRGRRRRFGYDIRGQHPQGKKLLNSFGNDPRLIVQIVEPRASNVGFAPVLPAPRAVRIRSENPPDSVRVRQDGAVDTGVLEAGQQLVALSSVSSDPRYGLDLEEAGPPWFKLQQPSPGIRLTTSERRDTLQLPEKLLLPNSRVRQLAVETLRSASPRESDYQRARRLALMLQGRAVYTLRPPAIPEKIDATEYFLFQSRRGYCTYFAGALTVLCRSVGIPARVVSGFVNPEWVENGQTGVLREANAHAWTEVWVEGWGWASVDATPPDNRGDNAPDWWENWTDLFGATLDYFRQWLGNNARLALGTVFGLILLVLFIAVRQGMADPLLARLQSATKGRVKLTQDQSRRAIFKAYGRVARKLARRFRNRTRWETPSEWLAAAESTLELENPQPLRQLTQLYLQAKYSPQEISSEDGATAMAEARRLTWRRKKLEA